MNTKIFTVAVLGFSKLEHSLVASVCKLSLVRMKQTRGKEQAAFQIQTAATNQQQADIYLIDTEAPNANDERHYIQAQQHSKPTILVAKETITTEAAHEYSLTRNRLGGLLLRLLDQIAKKLNHDVVDNNITQTKADARTLTRPHKSCLVVDDSQLVRTQMQMILHEYGLTIEFAESAEQALQLVKQQTFEIIFLDVMLPEMNGYKACKLLKSNPATSATPVVMLTSKKSPFNKMHGALVGCDKYLTKPIERNKLHQALTQYAVLHTRDVTPIGTRFAVSC